MGVILRLSSCVGMGLEERLRITPFFFAVGELRGSRGHGLGTHGMREWGRNMIVSALRIYGGVGGVIVPAPESMVA